MTVRRFAAFVVLLALAVAACAPAATPTPVATPTVVPVPATPTPLPPGVTPRLTPTPTGVAAVKPKYGGVLRVPALEDPPGWDGQVVGASAPPFRMIMASVFELLIRQSGSRPPGPCSFAPENNLAASWRYLDPLTLEVNIPQGVKFHNKPPVNGREMTADDVVYSLRRSLKLTPRMGAIAPFVASIEAKDRYTVLLLLTKPHAGLSSNSFLGSYWTGGILAREAGGTKESWGDPYTSWIATGPFVFRDYVPGVKTVLDRNPSYWKPGLPYVDRIEFPIMPDASTRTAALRSGRADVHTRFGLAWPMIRELRQTSPHLQVFQCPGDTQSLTSWRTDEPPFSDVRVRRAVSMLLDRKGLVEKVWEGQAILSGLISSQIHPYFLDLEQFPPEVRRYVEYRPEEAQRLLAEAGYPGGRGLEVTFTHTLRHPRAYIEWSESIIEAMGRAGIKVVPRWLEYAQYTATVPRGNFHGMGTGGITATDPYLLFELFLSTADPSQNKGRIKDPELDRLITEFFGTADEARARALARDIQIRIVDQVYFLVSPLTFLYTIWQPWVRDWLLVHENYSGAATEKVWLDK